MTPQQSGNTLEPLMQVGDTSFLPSFLDRQGPVPATVSSIKFGAIGFKIIPHTPDASSYEIIHTTFRLILGSWPRSSRFWPIDYGAVMAYIDKGSKVGTRDEVELLFRLAFRLMSAKNRDSERCVRALSQDLTVCRHLTSANTRPVSSEV